MNVELTRPEIERYVREQVDAGRFPSADAVVEAAVAQMMAAGDWDELTPADEAAIAEADAEIDRGEGIDFDAFAQEIRGRMKEG
jgi:Arc/MetJ-type ribon-helix-helix transcriptional regulator